MGGTGLRASLLSAVIVLSLVAVLIHAQSTSLQSPNTKANNATFSNQTNILKSIDQLNKTILDVNNRISKMNMTIQYLGSALGRLEGQLSQDKANLERKLQNVNDNLTRVRNDISSLNNALNMKLEELNRQVLIFQSISIVAIVASIISFVFALRRRGPPRESAGEGYACEVCA